MLVFAVPRLGGTEEIELEEVKDACFHAEASLPLSNLNSGNVMQTTLSARVRRRERVQIVANSISWHYKENKKIHFLFKSKKGLLRQIY